MAISDAYQDQLGERHLDMIEAAMNGSLLTSDQEDDGEEEQEGDDPDSLEDLGDDDVLEDLDAIA